MKRPILFSCLIFVAFCIPSDIRAIEVSISPLSTTAVVSSCFSPEIKIRADGITPGEHHVIVSLLLPQGIDLKEKSWEKTGNQKWTQNITVSCSDSWEAWIPVVITDLSALQDGKTQFEWMDIENQSVHIVQAPVVATSVIQISGQSTFKRASSQIFSDCGLKIYHLSGDMVVEQSESVDFNNAIVFVDEGAKIFVKNGGLLRLSHTLISSLCDHWEGIEVEQGGTLESDHSMVDGRVQEMRLSSGVTSFLQLYPNPSTDWFYAKIKDLAVGGTTVKRIEVIDMRGQLILPDAYYDSSMEAYRVETGALSSGIYIVRLFTDDLERSYCAKLIISR